MSVMITGASGFVGLNLMQRLLQAGEAVVAVSTTRLAPGIAQRMTALPGQLVEVIADVRDKAAIARLMSQHGVDRVAHMAAITSAADRERRAADDIVSVNLAGLASVVTAAAEARVKRFVNVGSIAVFGGQPPEGSLMDEDTLHAPQNLYGITKSAGEAIMARLGELHGLDWVTARLGRVFGPFEHDTGVRDTLSQIHQVTAHALAGRAVRFARPCVKNWNFAPDSARHLETLLMAKAPRHRVYNLGSEHAFSLAEWCALLAARRPGFDWRVGPYVEGDKAAVIDLGGAHDSGLLSWQRFFCEFHPAPSADLRTAFDLTLKSL